MKGAVELVRDAVDRDLLLLHALEQRRLRLRRGAVDLVDEQEVREDGARPELELVRALVEDVHAGHVRRQQVRRELHPREATRRASARAPSRASSCPRRESPRGSGGPRRRGRARTSRSVSSGACTTRPRLSTIARIVSAAAAVSTRWLSASLTQQLLSRIYDRRRDPVLRGLGDAALAARADRARPRCPRRRSRCRRATRRCRRRGRRASDLSFSRARETALLPGPPRSRSAPGRSCAAHPASASTSVVGSSVDFPRSSSFGRFVAGDVWPGGSRRRRRPSARGRRRAWASACVEHRLRRSGVSTTSTPGGAGDGEVRGEQGHVGAALAVPRRRGRRPCGRTSGCRGSGRASSGSRVPPARDEHAAAGERVGLAEQLRGSAGRSPLAPPSARRPTRLPPSRPRPGRRSRRRANGQVSTFACVAGMRPHARIHRGRDAAPGRGARARPRSTRLSASPWASFASVFAVSGATTSRSARGQVDVDVLGGRAPRERERTSRPGRTARRRA